MAFDDLRSFLQALDDHGQLLKISEQVALIEAAVSTKATLAEMLARMENRGLVRREHDPADKRRRFVWLTAEGEKILAAAIPIGDSVDEEFLGRLSGEEQELFMQLVRKMMNA
ncbi:MarR family winged helix-turn-helix transcriptional regulator [Escherichia coli]